MENNEITIGNAISKKNSISQIRNLEVNDLHLNNPQYVCMITLIEKKYKVGNISSVFEFKNTLSKTLMC